MARDPIPTHFFVLVVVRQDDRFLVIRERKHGQRWYIPAGRVEPREGFPEAAVRETLEEAGFPVRLNRILRFEHWPAFAGKARVRVVFEAVPDLPVDDPRGGEDALDAAWVTPAECEELNLRDRRIPDLFRLAASSDAGAPLKALAFELDDY